MPGMNIREMSIGDIPAYRAHFERHRAESGRGDPHFMPFELDDASGPTGLDPESLENGLDEPAWQRWFVALPDATDTIVGHVNLKGDQLATGLHRCELGIGIEREYRGAGLGRRLMLRALDFAHGEPALHWVELRVFGHNQAAQALYRELGFRECGRIRDRFRIAGQVIDDVIMVLEVG